jgi:hypothetical protein
MEIFLLWLITIQGFFVMFYEYDVWRMNKDRFQERKKWREEKQKQKLKKLEEKNGGPGIEKPE